MACCCSNCDAFDAPSCSDTPVYFDLSFSGFSYTWQGPDSSQDGYGSQLTQWLHSQSLRLTRRTGRSPFGVGAYYRSDGGCYSNTSCGASSPCANPGYAFLTPATYAHLGLTCAGQIVRVQYFISTQWSCWAQFPDNRTNHYLASQGDWRDGDRVHATFSFAVCSGQQSALVLPNPPNPGITQSFTEWTSFSTGRRGIYTSPTGSVTLTPTYPNPLP